MKILKPIVKLSVKETRLGVVVKKKRLKKPKFKLGDKVYNWQSPNKKASINGVRPSDDPDYQHAYRLILFDKNGERYNSKWTLESSCSKSKKN